MKHFYTFFLVLFSWIYVFSQAEMTMSLMTPVMQSSFINPASVPQHRLSIAMPGLGSIFVANTFTGFTYRDLVTPVGDSNLVNIYSAINKSSGQNYLYNASSIDLIAIRWRTRHLHFSIQISEKFESRFSYDQDLLKLMGYGTGVFVGSKVDLSHLALDATSYRSYAFGMSHSTDKWVIGGRFHVLSGHANVSMHPKNLGISVGTQEQNYAIGATADVTVNASNLPINTLNENFGVFKGIETGGISLNSNQKSSFNSGGIFGLQNPGFALDGGATYLYSKKISFQGFFNNLGFISWQSNAENHTVSGNRFYEGLDIAGKYIRGDSTYSNFKSYSDTLKTIFSYSRTTNHYTTWFTPQFYLGGQYQWRKNTQFGGLIRFEYNQIFRAGLTLSVSQKFGRACGLVGTYSMQYGRFDLVGLGFHVKPGPVQFYLVMDNVLALVSPLTSTHVNIRTGINFVFGRTKQPDQLDHPE